MNICVIVTNHYLHIIPLPGLSFYASALIGVLVSSEMTKILKSNLHVRPVNVFPNFWHCCSYDDVLQKKNKIVISYEMNSFISYKFCTHQSFQQ